MKKTVKNPWISIFIIVISILLMISILWIAQLATHFTGTNGTVIAHIYQNGKLLETIPLSWVQEEYTFTITGEGDCQNIICVKPGSIGMLEADCPDQLCVKQGFYDRPTIPITCLPNGLVIELTLEKNVSDDKVPDIISY